MQKAPFVVATLETLDYFSIITTVFFGTEKISYQCSLEAVNFDKA